MENYDVCIVGSGAGASPVAYELALAGFKVVVLEKGPWIKTEQFSKDERLGKNAAFKPNLKDEFHEIVRKNKEDEWYSKPTYESNSSFWNGNAVGGSSNFMSGYFHRLSESDFKLKSTYGSIEGANIEDWPIGLIDLKPFYDKVEKLVGISGDKESTPYRDKDKKFPYEALQTNVVAELIDEACSKLEVESFATPRAILSSKKDQRNPCYYSNFCGSYGCSSNAKGSGRAALLEPAIETGNLKIVSNAKVFNIVAQSGSVKMVSYYDKENNINHIQAKLFVIAAQAAETSRLLLMSKGEGYEKGIGNQNNQVGKNLLFSGGGVGSCQLHIEDFDSDTGKRLLQPGLFVNRASQHWYEIQHPEKGLLKGGTIDFLWEHANMLGRTFRNKWDGSRLMYGKELKEKIKEYFTQQRKLMLEIFVDWLPHDDCRVELSDKYTDKWGDPVGKLYVANHPHDRIVGSFIADESRKILQTMGGRNIKMSISNNPTINLQAGGCRFGNDPKTSVLDKNCKVHSLENLYITDGSFMPTGGSITYTWTIYANAFRVAESIKSHLRSMNS